LKTLNEKSASRRKRLLHFDETVGQALSLANPEREDRVFNGAGAF